MERSKTDQALVEEALRYGDDFVSWGRRDFGSSPFILFILVVQGKIPLRMVTASRITEGVTTTCWDLIEVNNGSNKKIKVELCSAQSDWEESSLARTLEVLDLEVGQYSDSCRFKNVEDGFVWMFMGVYGPFTREEMECLWEELGAIRGIWEDPWCLGEGLFTWNGRHNNQSWARLDIFLVTQNWLDQFSGVFQSKLPRPTSNHFLILLESGGLRIGPSHFRFENMWLKV
ncbi:hypothetical protein AAG906_031708 [Vitis piasezkii]